MKMPKQRPNEFLKATITTIAGTMLIVATFLTWKGIDIANMTIIYTAFISLTLNVWTKGD